MSEQTILQTLAAAEKAGLLPNTIHDWLPALLRYNEAFLASQPKPAPVLLTDDEIDQPFIERNRRKFIDRSVARAIEFAVLRKNGWGV